ncbi:MAG: hypothetical protein ACREO7_01405 [Pseudoxanthomonas sp.]
MDHKYLAAFVLALAGAAPTAWAGECETNFAKSGSIFTGTDFSSSVTVPDLSVANAMGQMRGIMIAEKMDVITEDAETGSMLVEQRSTNTLRAIPTLINVSGSGTAATVEMTVKTEKGQMAKQDVMRPYMCELLARLKGGKEGRAAAAQGARAKNNDDTTIKDVYVFSREIAREAKGNAVAVTARHKGRKYGLKGRVDYIQEDGEDYNVSFDIPDQSKMLLQVPGDNEPRVGVACLFRPNQLANVLTFRKGDKATFTGTFLRYDDRKRTLWLQNCVQAKK